MAEFVQNAPLIVFAFMAGIPALIAAGSLAAGLYSLRNARAISSAPSVAPGDLTEGYRLVEGRIAAKASARAPLTGRSCAWWEAKVHHASKITNDRDASRSWSSVRDERSKAAIVVEDAGGSRCRVEPHGALVHAGGWSEWYGPSPTPPATKSGRDPEIRPGTIAPGGAGRIEVMSDPDKAYRYLERYLWAGEPVFVLGEAVRDGGGGWRIGKAKGRPFLISAQSPEAIWAESRLAIAGGLIMGLLAGAATAALVWLRMGG